jgi:hypothetical protein
MIPALFLTKRHDKLKLVAPVLNAGVHASAFDYFLPWVFAYSWL